MQNKPNFDKGQNKPNPLYKKDLRKFFTPSDNEKQTQNKPNSLNAQMNVNTVITMNYEQITMNNANKNKPNSNPIKPNFKGKKEGGCKGEELFGEYAVLNFRGV